MSIDIKANVPITTSLDSSLTYGGIKTSSIITGSIGGSSTIASISGLQAALDSKLVDNLLTPIGTVITTTGNDLNVLTGLSIYGLTGNDMKKLADINTATAVELDYMAGATSNIQAQLNTKIDNNYTIADQIHLSTGANVYTTALLADVLNGTTGIGYDVNSLKAPVADFTMNSNKITNVTDPLAPQDVATKNYVDVTYGGLSASGFTMTGIINMNGNRITLDTSGSSYIDNSIDTNTSIVAGGHSFTFKNPELDLHTAVISNMVDPTNLQDGATKNYVDTGFLSLSGGTLSGNLLTSGVAKITPLSQMGTPSFAFQSDDTTGMGNPAIGTLEFYSSGSTSLTLQTAGSTLADALIAGSSSLSIPSGTTSQRPSIPAVGYMRFNTTLSAYEGYNGTSWVSFESPANTLTATNNLSDITSVTSAINNLGLNTGGMNDIWLDSTGDISTGSLTFSGGSLVLDPARSYPLGFSGDLSTGLAHDGLGKYSIILSGTRTISFDSSGTGKVIARFIGTNGITIPVGTTAQRPTINTEGTIRYNSTLSAYEGYSNLLWREFAVNDSTKIAYNPLGNIIATNVSSAIHELDLEKLAIDGSSTMTGNLDMGGGTIINIGDPMTIGNATLSLNNMASTITGNTPVIEYGIGSSTAPTYSFNSSTNTGIWYDGASMQLALGGNNMISIGTNISVNNKQIKDVADPVLLTDAVNVNYLVNNGFLQVLGTATNIDMTTASNNTIYTVPVGERHVISEIILITTAYGANIGFSNAGISIGTNITSNNITLSNIPDWGGTSGAVNSIVKINIDNGSNMPTAGDVISLKVTTPAGLFTALTVTAIITGFAI